MCVVVVAVRWGGLWWCYWRPAAVEGALLCAENDDETNRKESIFPFGRQES